MRQPQQLHIDVGDISIAVNEWQGSGDPILMLHATGFHSRCWDQVIQRLPERHIFAADLRFHGASGSAGQVSWDVMCDDIASVVEQLDLTNALGVGHSIGGYITTRVAARLPQRFRELLLLDPVIMPPDRLRKLGALNNEINVCDHPVSKRKNHWSGPSEMFERFALRAPFDSWQSSVLRDYCNHALAPADADGTHQLACKPQHEASIYLNQPKGETIYAEIPNIHLPITVLRAPPATNDPFDFSASPTWPALASELPNGTEVYLPQMNHFIPMQDPALVAKYISAAQST